MISTIMRLDRKGVTLIELLVVLIIIGILGAVTLRAMDVTRERSNQERTFKTMERLSNAIAGNPTMIAEGRRSDFGFVGDMGRLPANLDELREAPVGNQAWNGPYARLPFDGDIISFKTDGWGQELQFIPDQGLIVSLGNGKFPITYRVTEDTTFLVRNRVSGTITDFDGNPPGVQSANVHVRIWVTDPATGQAVAFDTLPNASGYYDFNPNRFRIPVGNHLMQVVRTGALTESLTKFVSVNSRVGAVVDFRLASRLQGSLELITGSQTWYGTDSNHVSFEVYNTSGAAIGIDTLVMLSCSEADSTFFAEVWSRGTRRWLAGATRAGVGDTVNFSVGDSVPGGARLRLDLKGFDYFRSGITRPRSMVLNSLGIRFNDGSIVNFTLP